MDTNPRAVHVHSPVQNQQARTGAEMSPSSRSSEQHGQIHAGMYGHGEASSSRSSRGSGMVSSGTGSGNGNGNGSPTIGLSGSPIDVPGSRNSLNLSPQISYTASTSSATSTIRAPHHHHHTTHSSPQYPHPSPDGNDPFLAGPYPASTLPYPTRSISGRHSSLVAVNAHQAQHQYPYSHIPVQAHASFSQHFPPVPPARTSSLLESPSAPAQHSPTVHSSVAEMQGQFPTPPRRDVPVMPTSTGGGLFSSPSSSRRGLVPSVQVIHPTPTKKKGRPRSTASQDTAIAPLSYPHSGNGGNGSYARESERMDDDGDTDSLSPTLRINPQRSPTISSQHTGTDGSIKKRFSIESKRGFGDWAADIFRPGSLSLGGRGSRKSLEKVADKLSGSHASPLLSASNTNSGFFDDGSGSSSRPTTAGTEVTDGDTSTIGGMREGMSGLSVDVEGGGGTGYSGRGRPRSGGLRNAAMSWRGAVEEMGSEGSSERIERLRSEEEKRARTREKGRERQRRKRERDKKAREASNPNLAGPTRDPSSSNLTTLNPLNIPSPTSSTYSSLPHVHSTHSFYSLSPNQSFAFSASSTSLSNQSSPNVLFSPCISTPGMGHSTGDLLWMGGMSGSTSMTDLTSDIGNASLTSASATSLTMGGTSSGKGKGKAKAGRSLFGVRKSLAKSASATTSAITSAGSSRRPSQPGLNVGAAIALGPPIPGSSSYPGGLLQPMDNEDVEEGSSSGTGMGKGAKRRKSEPEPEEFRHHPTHHHYGHIAGQSQGYTANTQASSENQGPSRDEEVGLGMMMSEGGGAAAMSASWPFLEQMGQMNQMGQGQRHGQMSQSSGGMSASRAGNVKVVDQSIFQRGRPRLEKHHSGSAITVSKSTMGLGPPSTGQVRADTFGNSAASVVGRAQDVPSSDGTVSEVRRPGAASGSLGIHDSPETLTTRDEWPRSPTPPPVPSLPERYRNRQAANVADITMSPIASVLPPPHVSTSNSPNPPPLIGGAVPPQSEFELSDNTQPMDIDLSSSSDGSTVKSHRNHPMSSDQYSSANATPASTSAATMNESSTLAAQTGQQATGPAPTRSPLPPPTLGEYFASLLLLACTQTPGVAATMQSQLGLGVTELEGLRGELGGVYDRWARSRDQGDIGASMAIPVPESTTLPTSLTLDTSDMAHFPMHSQSQPNSTSVPSASTIDSTTTSPVFTTANTDFHSYVPAQGQGFVTPSTTRTRRSGAGQGFGEAPTVDQLQQQMRLDSPLDMLIQSTTAHRGQQIMDHGQDYGNAVMTPTPLAGAHARSRTHNPASSSTQDQSATAGQGVQGTGHGNGHTRTRSLSSASMIARGLVINPNSALYPLDTSNWTEHDRDLGGGDNQHNELDSPTHSNVQTPSTGQGGFVLPRSFGRAMAEAGVDDVAGSQETILGNGKSDTTENAGGRDHDRSRTDPTHLVRYNSGQAIRDQNDQSVPRGGDQQHDRHESARASRESLRRYEANILDSPLAMTTSRNTRNRATTIPGRNGDNLIPSMSGRKPSQPSHDPRGGTSESGEKTGSEDQVMLPPQQHSQVAEHSQSSSQTAQLQDQTHLGHSGHPGWNSNTTAESGSPTGISASGISDTKYAQAQTFATDFTQSPYNADPAQAHGAIGIPSYPTTTGHDLSIPGSVSFPPPTSHLGQYPFTPAARGAIRHTNVIPFTPPTPMPLKGGGDGPMWYHPSFAAAGAFQATPPHHGTPVHMGSGGGMMGQQMFSPEYGYSGYHNPAYPPPAFPYFPLQYQQPQQSHPHHPGPTSGGTHDSIQQHHSMLDSSTSSTGPSALQSEQPAGGPSHRPASASLVANMAGESV